VSGKGKADPLPRVSGREPGGLREAALICYGSNQETGAGKLPVDTNGSGLSCAHPGRYGIFTLIETTEQVRGSAGVRQVPDAEVTLRHGNGGHLSS
jgi:acetyl-CoA acetyltransferase